MAQPQEGAPARPRTRRSRWRPCLDPHARAARAGSPLAGRGCNHTRAGLGVAGSRADTGGGAYKSPPGKRIARSDGGTRPSSRFPTRSLQPNGGSTLKPKATKSHLQRSVPPGEGGPRCIKARGMMSTGAEPARPRARPRSQWQRCTRRNRRERGREWEVHVRQHSQCGGGQCDRDVL